MDIYTFCCSLRENTHSFVWNGDQQCEDTFISAKKRTFAPKSDSITFSVIHLRHSTYKREKYTFINANVRESLTLSWKSLGTIDKHLSANVIHEHFYDTVCNSTAFLDSIRMDKSNINALVQSIERSLHLIYKSLFSIKRYQFPPHNWPEFM